MQNSNSIPAINNQLQEAMWNDLHNEKSFPEARPLLAHYTSIATLEQVMANDEIWFSNPLYMNDWEELRFGMNEGAAEFRVNDKLREACKSESNHSKLVYYFDHLFHEFDSKHAFNTYVLCLTEHAPTDNDGVLSMWRGYGDSASGVAIVFDTGKIEANESSPLIISKVEYGTTDDRRGWIKNKINDVAEIIWAHELTDQMLFDAAYFWIERLKIFSLFSKHSGFTEENEWRVVYMSERDKSEAFKSMLSYAITARGAEPKLKLKIKPLDGIFSVDLSLEKLIDRIILGPTTSTVLAANSIKRVLIQKNKPALAEKVKPSTIPFRT